MPDGRDVLIFTLRNQNGTTARVTEYGAILVSLETADQHGNMADVTLGYETLEGWLKNSAYFGATIGRCGGRIKEGKFTLDGQHFDLVTNNAPGGIPCHLHGGLVGFDKVLWSGKIVGTDSVELTYFSKDGEEGYPGNLNIKVTYTLTADDELKWEVEATSDAATIVNIVHHTYWNLSGDPTTSINDHQLTLNAASYLPTNAGLIPTGEIAAVAGTPMDFTQPKTIGERVEDDFEALKFGNGYDHTWVLENGGETRLAAVLKDPKSGRVMEVFTDQPAIQFYGGNFLDGSAVGKRGVRYDRRGALCLETQGFPDAANQPKFPPCVLNIGETYKHTLIHRFSAKPTANESH